MTIELLIKLFLSGALVGNVIASSGIGVEFAFTGLNSVKNSLIYSLIIFISLFFGGVFVYLINMLLVSVDLTSFLVLVILLVVSCIVQICELVINKIAPLFFMQVRYFMPTMVGSCFIILLFAWVSSLGAFLPLLIYILCVCIGILAVVTVVSGVRSDRSRLSLNDELKGNLLSVIIVFVVALIWTAI